MPSRFGHLVRHGLVGSALLAAAGSNASAEPCDWNADRTIAFVLGVQVSPGVKLVGGIEGRMCMNDKTEALARFELGGGSPRFIAGARVRPFESSVSDSDSEHLGVEAGAALDFKSKFGIHLAGTYGTHSAYLAVQALVQPASDAQGDKQRWSILGGLAPWTAMGPTVVEGRPIVADGHMLRPRVLSRATTRDRELTAVRDHFISSAQLELSSVWTFLRLATELAAIGAPAELVASALDAANDELRHAEHCGALAGGLSLAALPAHVGAPRFSSASGEALATLVAEAWCEGCLNETAAAEEARLAAADAHGDARSILANIARDEQGHAELSWRVLAWAQSIAPELARSTIASLPEYAVDEASAPVDPALARYGVPTQAITRAARAHAASTAHARLAALAA